MQYFGFYRVLADTDLLTMVLTLASVLRRAPAILRQRPPIPAKYEIEEISVDRLTEKQREFFDSYDRQFAELNYFPVCTYRIANLERTLIRSYANPTDPARCDIAALEVRYQYKGQIRWAPARVMRFRTDFTDGTSLVTRNAKRRTLFDTLPGFTIQECPAVEDPAMMKKIHDAKAAEMGCPQTRSNDIQRFFEQIQDEHRRFSEFQIDRGLYAYCPEGYVLTSKTHWRAIRNHYNPFVQRIAPIRLAICAVIAVGIPSFAHAFSTSSIRSASPAEVMNVAFAGEVWLFLSYITAGLAMGLLIERNSFLWAFLLTYLGVHLCTGWWLSTIPFSTIAALTAFWVTRLQHKRKLMLAPTTSIC
jgi:hypothetical protein